jgi:hypothetical protein
MIISIKSLHQKFQNLPLSTKGWSSVEPWIIFFDWRGLMLCECWKIAKYNPKRSMILEVMDLDLYHSSQQGQSPTSSDLICATMMAFVWNNSDVPLRMRRRRPGRLLCCLCNSHTKDWWLLRTNNLAWSTGWSLQCEDQGWHLNGNSIHVNEEAILSFTALPSSCFFHFAAKLQLLLS